MYCLQFGVDKNNHDRIGLVDSVGHRCINKNMRLNKNLFIQVISLDGGCIAYNLE